jgi:hypothetical protein
MESDSFAVCLAPVVESREGGRRVVAGAPMRSFRSGPSLNINPCKYLSTHSPLSTWPRRSCPICRLSCKAVTHTSKTTLIAKVKLDEAFVHLWAESGSRKAGQAAGAGGLKQDRYVGICDIRPCFCGLTAYLTEFQNVGRPSYLASSGRSLLLLRLLPPL